MISAVQLEFVDIARHMFLVSFDPAEAEDMWAGFYKDDVWALVADGYSEWVSDYGPCQRVFRLCESAAIELLTGSVPEDTGG